MYTAIAVSLLVLCRGDALLFNYTVIAYFSFIIVFLLGASLIVVGACTQLLTTIASANAVAVGGASAASLDAVAVRVRKIRLAFAALMVCLLIILLPFEVTYLATGMAPYACVHGACRRALTRGVELGVSNDAGHRVHLVAGRRGQLRALAHIAQSV